MSARESTCPRRDGGRRRDMMGEGRMMEEGRGRGAGEGQRRRERVKRRVEE